MMPRQNSISSKARNNTGRDARYKNTDVARAPATETETAEMKRCHDHATAGRAGSGGDCAASGTSQGEAAFQLGEGGCVQPTE